MLEHSATSNEERIVTIVSTWSLWKITTRPPLSPVANSSPSALNSTHEMMSATNIHAEYTHGKRQTLAYFLSQQIHHYFFNNDYILHMLTKVRTDSSTEFGSNPIFVDRVRIESAAGSNPILIVQIRTGLDRSVDFNKRIRVSTTGTACTPSSDIKGRIRQMYTSDIENRQHRSLEHRRRQITDVDRIQRHRYQWRRRSAAATI